MTIRTSHTNPLDSYREVVRVLESFVNAKERVTDRRRRRRESFRRFQRFLTLLGHPERYFDVVHVTGTSGKGTVASRIHAMLVAAGDQAGLFTSPHVTTTLERISVGPCFITSEQFVEAATTVFDSLDRWAVRSLSIPTRQELLAAIAFVAFRSAGVRTAVIEAYCGGAFDPTNVVTRTRLAVITNVDRDHVDLLGPTLADIARDKAGIIKPHARVVTAEPRRTLQQVLASVARRAGTEIEVVRSPLRATPWEVNDLLARRAGEVLGLSTKAITAGLEASPLPGRYERIGHHPTVLLDIAHNPAKLNALARRLASENVKRIHIIFGCVAMKDGAVLLRPLMPLATTLTLTRTTMPFRRATNPARLRLTLPRRIQAHTRVILDPLRALDAVRATARSQDLVVVTGSAYLVGDVRRRWFPEEAIVRAGTATPRLRLHS